MSIPIQPQEVAPETLRKVLAVAVRSIQWSYAIFWSLSTTQDGVLQWGNGYYNGDIKTRKTLQAMELKPDKIGFQRSEQLRELYGVLLEGEINPNKEPSVGLSPEDLSDAEWYYLVCMSFAFDPGQDLPGRALEKDESVWLCNAHYADSKVFSRSLLAKSASIQTVVCFPYLGGVIELGVTDLVQEDSNLLQHIKASLLDMSKPVCSEKSGWFSHNADDDIDPVCIEVDQEIVETLDLDNLYSPAEDIGFNPEEGIEKFYGITHDDINIGSADECSNGCEHNYQTDDSSMLEGPNGVASQVNSWHFMDDERSHGAIVDGEKADFSSPMCGSINHSHTKPSSIGLQSNDDLHYEKTLSVILGDANGLSGIPGFRSVGCKSGFLRWKKGGLSSGYSPGVPQNILKKILFAVPLMHGSNRDDLRENEKFLVLKSMVPSISKVDKASILDDTIKYLKELKARVEELESSMDSVDIEARTRKSYPDVKEETSDNYEIKKATRVKKCSINKRKASDIDETSTERDSAILVSDLSVSIKEQEVLIEMKCPYREYILPDIMDAINNLHLDAHSVKSFSLDGNLMLTLKTKFRGTAVAPARMIKQALQKVAGKC